MFRIFDPMSFFYCFSFSTLAKVFICKAVYQLIFVFLYKKLLKTFCAKSFIQTCHITKFVLFFISFQLILTYQHFKCYFHHDFEFQHRFYKIIDYSSGYILKKSNHNHQLLYMAIFNTHFSILEC